MAINDVTTAIKFLKKTYPFKDAEALSKVEDQNVQGILNFQNGIQLFGTDVKLIIKDGDYIINFGDESGEAPDILDGYCSYLSSILEAKGIKTSKEDGLGILIGKINKLVNPETIGSNSSIIFVEENDDCIVLDNIYIQEEEE